MHIRDKQQALKVMRQLAEFETPVIIINGENTTLGFFSTDERDGYIELYGREEPTVLKAYTTEDTPFAASENSQCICSLSFNANDINIKKLNVYVESVNEASLGIHQAAACSL